MTPPDPLDERIRRLEARILESAEELRALRQRLLKETRAELREIKDEWHGVDRRWRVVALAAMLAFFLVSYALYTRLGWVADQRALPMGDDWLLRRLPAVNVLPVLSWGWFGLHLFALGAVIAYAPRRLAFLMFMLAVYVAIRTAFIFLSPIGAPLGMVDMRKLDWIFSRLIGSWTFSNEFVFSGHTSIPFLFFLFFETPGLKTAMLTGSIVMAACVLLSHNHYTVDVLAAYLASYSIYRLSEWFYYRWVRPLFPAADEP